MTTLDIQQSANLRYDFALLINEAEEVIHIGIGSSLLRRLHWNRSLLVVLFCLLYSLPEYESYTLSTCWDFICPLSLQMSQTLVLI